MSMHIERTFLQKTKASQTKKLHIKPGQFFQGKIVKLYPNRLAALQLGQMALTAKLDAALTAGQRYWFQAQQSEGIPRLKVLDDNMMRTSDWNGSRQASTQSMLQYLGLSKTKANETLLQFLVKEQLPFTKEVIGTGAALLQQSGQIGGNNLDVLKAMIQHQLPLTKDTFAAIQAVRSGELLSTQVGELLTQLDQVSEKQGSLQQTTQALRSIWQLTNVSPGQVDGPAEQRLMQWFLMASNHELPLSTQEGAGRLLQRVGAMPQDLSIADGFQQLEKAIRHPDNQEKVAQMWPSLSGSPSTTASIKESVSSYLHLLISKLNIPAGQLSTFLSLLNHQVSSEEVFARLAYVEQGGQPLHATEKEVLHQQSNRDQRIPSFVDQLTQLISRLGYSHEQDLLASLADKRTSLPDGQTLKSQLMQLREFDLPENIQQKAETIVQRLTGHQLLMNDQQGPLFQQILQVPLTLGRHSTDMTIQWEGKKNQEGEIDPDHCRILFYLTLEQLQETIVDVQVQNRILSVQIFNESPGPQTLLDRFQPLLKEQLSELDYQLTSIKWKELGRAQVPSQKPNGYQQHASYQGVDIRI